LGGTEGPLSHADPNSKFTHMKEESLGGVPRAGGSSGAPDSSDTSASSGSDSKDDSGGRRGAPGPHVPRSGRRDAEPRARPGALPRREPAPSGPPVGGAGAERRAQPGRPYLCGVCGKSFRHRRSLLAHKRLRGGARARHGCSECGRAFCLRGDLLRHRDAHRARPAGPRRLPGEERPFVCGSCGRGFSWRESLELHLRGHRGPQ
ncbi:ZN568 protein, partial [Hirundo rustica]|nr:ZN568 protein [Hirundo rustica]